MYVSPNHPCPPRQPTPPEQRGLVLARISRSDDEELRIALDEYRGHRYLALRVWERGRDGQWWPVKAKGLSIRLREVADVAKAFAQAAGMMQASPSGNRQSAAVQGRLNRDPGSPDARDTSAPAGQEPFDEFSGCQ